MAVCGRGLFPTKVPVVPTTLLVELADVVRDAAEVVREEAEESECEKLLVRGPTRATFETVEFM